MAQSHSLAKSRPISERRLFPCFFAFVFIQTPIKPPHGGSHTDLPFSDTEYATLINLTLTTIQVVPRQLRPLEGQLPNASRNLWRNVMENLIKEGYPEAAKEKHALKTLVFNWCTNSDSLWIGYSYSY